MHGDMWFSVDRFGPGDSKRISNEWIGIKKMTLIPLIYKGPPACL